MPPHLHPRSTATSTLFAGTLLASFVVVGIPHIFPCPRPRTGYADIEIQFDDEGKPIRRIVRRNRTEAKPQPLGDQDSPLMASGALQHQSIGARKSLSQSKDLEEEAALFRALQREAEILEKEARESRECPVPKPRGLLGQLLGFEEKKAAVGTDGKS